VSKGNAEMIAAAVRTIFAQPDDQHVHAQLDVISGLLGKQFPIVETMLQEGADDLLTFVAFLLGHWKKIWSSNPLSSGSTRRSNDAPTSSASFPTPKPSFGSPVPSWSRPTTNGPSPTGATCRRTR
jgi:putative transposase